MPKFTFRAYVPPRADPSPLKNPGPAGQHQQCTDSVFRAYVPPASLIGETQSFPHPMPPLPPSFGVYSSTPPPVSKSYANSFAKRGSYQHDLDSGEYLLSWNSLADMQAWLRQEETDKSISLLLKEAVPNKGKTPHEWTMKHIYVCGRMGTGGKSRYVPTTNQRRKIPSKRISCPCRITAKSYPGTNTILGRYEDSHSHPIGAENLIYTRIPLDIRHRIKQDLRDGIKPDVVLARARGNVHDEQNLPNGIPRAPRREQFITKRDVRRIQEGIICKSGVVEELEIKTVQ
ncbi:hypothetical protein DFH06DRAFT_95942 [Mycena polygramma]|nr:hypothetical protein DFH06DRAFT_95942 [Mycena polygramma]